MRRDIVTSALGLLVLTIVLGVAYPLAIYAAGQVVFPGQANGELVRVGGRVAGSKRIGQSFGGDPRYFQSRPSASTPPYNAAASTFSNLGPNSIATERAIAANIAGYLARERPYVRGLTAGNVPVDAANSSASGLDPDISVANAEIQAHRVAAVRHLGPATVGRLISENTDGRSLGILGEPGVNVLGLNLALDRREGR